MKGTRSTEAYVWHGHDIVSAVFCWAETKGKASTDYRERETYSLYDRKS